MRPGLSDTLFRRHRSQRHMGGRLKKTRKSRDFRFDLEGLELQHVAVDITGSNADDFQPDEPVGRTGERT